MPTVPSENPQTWRGHLLPRRTPVLPCLVTCAHTEPAGAGGTDSAWFEALALPGGGLGVAVGDAVGTDPDAAAAAGQLRAVATEALLEGVEPPVVLERLDRLARHLRSARGGTAAVLALEPDGRVALASRGHPLPVVVTPSGTARALAAPPCPPLGLGTGGSALVEQVAPGGAVIAYTLGALPRGAPPGAADDLRAAWAARGAAVAQPVSDPAAPASPGTVAHHVVGHEEPCFTRPPLAVGPNAASIVTVAFRTAPTGLDLCLTTPTDGAAAAAALGQWLAHTGASEDDRFDLQHAVAAGLRALAETERHPGPPDHACAAHLAAALDAQGVVTVTVGPPGPGQGVAHTHAWGLAGLDAARALIGMLRLVDEVRVDATGPVPTLVLRHALGRPAAVLAGLPGMPPVTAAIPPADIRAVRVSSTERVVRVSGVVEGESVEDLRLTLEASARTGQRLVVDVGASLLGPGAIALLHQAVGAGRVQVRARPGGPAAGSLTMAAVPFLPGPAR